MSERESYEPGVPCWVASVQPEPAAVVPFYEGLFGWEARNLMPDDHPGDYFVCTLGGREVAAIVSTHGGAPPPPAAVWTTHVAVESADDTGARAVEAGGSVLGEPFDSPGGGRMAVIADPAGAVFAGWEPQDRHGAQLVNDWSAWSMSLLMSPDTDRARRFYGDVFGWETESFGGGIDLWRLPGYLGGEPGQPVPRDVVATMAPGDEPSWDVDFWIDDFDAAVARAPELGGSVVAPPSEPIPGFKQAVLADPAGATFSISRPAKP